MRMVMVWVVIMIVIKMIMMWVVIMIVMTMIMIYLKCKCLLVC